MFWQYMHFKKQSLGFKKVTVPRLRSTIWRELCYRFVASRRKHFPSCLNPSHHSTYRRYLLVSLYKIRREAAAGMLKMWKMCIAHSSENKYYNTGHQHLNSCDIKGKGFSPGLGCTVIYLRGKKCQQVVHLQCVSSILIFADHPVHNPEWEN